MAGAVACLVAVCCGVAIAAGVSINLPFSGDGNTINGCYSNGGALKVLTPTATTCPGGYVPIHWNVTGPKGDQGIPGIQGTQGPKGDTGATGRGITGSHLVIATSATDASNLHFATASCPAGEHVTGGGGRILGLIGLGNAAANVLQDSSPQADRSGWNVEAFWNGSDPIQSWGVSAYAICAQID